MDKVEISDKSILVRPHYKHRRIQVSAKTKDKEIQIVGRSSRCEVLDLFELNPSIQQSNASTQQNWNGPTDAEMLKMKKSYSKAITKARKKPKSSNKPTQFQNST